MQRCPYIHEMKERLLNEQQPAMEPLIEPAKEIIEEVPRQISPRNEHTIGTVVKLNSDGFGSHTSPTHQCTPLVTTKIRPFDDDNFFYSTRSSKRPKNAKTSLFIIMSFIYAKILVIVCIAYVISDVVTHSLPLYYYEGFFTYLYGVSILFLLYVFCFLLQESSCCAGDSGGEKRKKPKPVKEKKIKPPKEEKKKEEKKKEKEKDKKSKDKSKDKGKGKDKDKDKDKEKEKEEKEREQREIEEKEKEREREREKESSKNKKNQQIQQDIIDVEQGIVSRPVRKRKTTQNDGSYGSFFLRIGAIGFGLGTMIYNGLEFGTFFEVPFTSPCYQVLRGVNPVLQMVFTFMQMYFIFMNSRLNIHRFKVIARFGLMHVFATNICVWFRTLVLEYMKEITTYHLRHPELTHDEMFAESIRRHTITNSGRILGTETGNRNGLSIEYPSFFHNKSTAISTTTSTTRQPNAQGGGMFRNFAQYAAQSVTEASNIAARYWEATTTTSPPTTKVNRDYFYKTVMPKMVKKSHPNPGDFIQSKLFPTESVLAPENLLPDALTPKSTLTKISEQISDSIPDILSPKNLPDVSDLFNRQKTPQDYFSHDRVRDNVQDSLTDTFDTIKDALPEKSLVENLSSLDLPQSVPSEILSATQFPSQIVPDIFEASSSTAGATTTLETSTVASTLVDSTTSWFPTVESTIKTVVDSFGFDSFNTPQLNGTVLFNDLVPQALTSLNTTNNNVTISNSSESITCGRVNIMGNIVQDSAPYLFPFIIEYSLIGAAVIYVMWKHIGHYPRYITEEDLEHRLEVMLSRRAVAMAQAQQGRVDCVGASKGLFFGLLLLVGSLICLILFFVLIHHPELGLLAIYLSDVSHCALMGLSILAIFIGFIRSSKLRSIYNYRVQHLKFRTEEQNNLNDILLRISAFGLFIYAVFSVIAGSANALTDEPSLLVTITGALSIVQVILQLLFIADVARRRVYLPEHDRSKPGRQIVTFLLICNVTMWIIYTFEMQKVEANPIQLKFYGFLTWSLIQRITLPLCIFHRFHSAVTLAEIWKTSYKARLE